MHVFSLVWCNFLLWSLNKLNIRPVFGHTQFEPRNFKHILFLLTFPLHTTVLAENNIFNLLSFIISVSCVCIWECTTIMQHYTWLCHVVCVLIIQILYANHNWQHTKNLVIFKKKSRLLNHGKSIGMIINPIKMSAKK